MNSTQRTLKFFHYVPQMKVVLSKMSVTNSVFFGLFFLTNFLCLASQSFDSVTCAEHMFLVLL